jgi:predicted transcriptional regulator
MLGVTRTTVWSWEKGMNDYSRTTAEQLKIAGFDMLYINQGKRTQTLETEEIEKIENIVKEVIKRYKNTDS